jgi:sugar lactone lactonase YvrE
VSASSRTSEVELALDAHAETGEGPVWDHRDQSLLWIDVTGGLVHRLDPITGRDESFHVGQHVGALALRSAGGFVLAVRGGFAGFDLVIARPLPIADTEAATPTNRMNDGKVDSKGRFWAGSMAYTETGREGSLYRLDQDQTVTKVLSGLGISNGLGWSPDDSVMYHIDSLTGGIDAYDFNADTGQITNRHRLIDIERADGIPDGMTVDREGYLWVALWNGWGVRRYGPDGTLDRGIRLPVRQVSCCTFGGPDMRDLYITTAARGLSPRELTEQPRAGGVFRYQPGVSGLPSRAYEG